MNVTDRSYEHTEGLEILTEARRYNAFLRDLVRSAAPAACGEAVDFGAGIGTFSSALEGLCPRTVCVEIDPAHRQRLAVLGHQVRDLGEIHPSSVDYVYSLNVLEHIDDDIAILKGLYRVLRPGGRLFVYTPALEMLWSSMDDLVGHVRRYRRSSLRQSAEAAGFRVLRDRYCDTAGLFATMAYKVLGRKDGKVGLGTLRVFDQIAFPVGRVLDRTGMQFVAGKNTYIIAERPE